MQEPVAPKDASNPKLRKKKPSTQVASAIQMQKGIKVEKETPHPSVKPKKGSKKRMMNDVSPPFQQTYTATPDSVPDSSGSSEEYRALRRKYLLLEEESFSLGKELSKVEAEVTTLEDEKLELLDQLVVLEGLIDPSELQPRHGL